MKKENTDFEIRPWLIMKFGGSSVANPEHWPTIVKILQTKISLGYKPFLVLSALKEVSNQLESLLNLSIQNKYQEAIEKLALQHRNFAKALNVSETIIEKELHQLTLECAKIHEDKCFDGKNHAEIVSYGEILSTRIAQAYLEQHLPTQWLDVRTVLQPARYCYQCELPDQWHHYVSARFDVLYDKHLDLSFQQKAGVIVTQGFMARDEQSHTILLGREGSDTSASYLAVILGATQLEIWTDVSGIFTMDPAINKNSKQFNQLSYDEVRRMANFGAKVLHPNALLPIAEKQIELVVRGIKTHHLPGTLISKKINCSQFLSVLSVVHETHICLIQLPNNKLKEPQFSRLLNAGFDKVFYYKMANEMHFIFKFVDSARHPVNPHEIVKATIAGAIDVTNNLTLITLIGTPISLSSFEDNQNSNWMNQITLYCKQQEDLKVFSLYPFPEVGRISILVDNSNTDDWTKRLHKHYIEPGITTHPELFY